MSDSIITIVGNRPQFIKMASVTSEMLSRGHKEVIIHTGQHFDDNMSKIFFQELRLPKPDYNLCISGGSHGSMTGSMLINIESIFLDEKPKGVLLYGDTNSTLAAALAAVKLRIPVAHVEAGPRLYDINTPEEINRIVSDHSSKLLFCPDLQSVQNLAKENIFEGVYFTGDVMLDSFIRFSEMAKDESDILEKLDVVGREYALLTVHRPDNTDNIDALRKIVEIVNKSPVNTVFPVHPRTMAAFKSFKLWDELRAIPRAKIIPALGYLDIMQLINNSLIILTDSGGLQKEAFFSGKPVITLFSTPWPHIESYGWLKCCWVNGSLDVGTVLREINDFRPKGKRPDLFGDGKASAKIVDILENQGWI